VHIDTHSDIKTIDPSSLSMIIRTTNQKALQNLESYPDKHYERREKPLTIGNFIYAAMQKGMIKEYYWVVPDLEINEISIDNYSLYFLRHLQDISFKRFEKSGDGIYQSWIDNIPIYICRLADLPEFAEPVLLDIDMDYFAYDNAINQNRLMSPRIYPGEIATVLKDKNTRVELATISRGNRGGYSPLEFRYLGDAFFRIFHEPTSIDVDYLDFLSSMRSALGQMTLPLIIFLV